MRRWVSALVGVCALVFLAAPARAEPAPNPPGAWILVDNDTGAVVEAGNARAPMRPASVAKILTALTAVQLIKADAQVPISMRAEGAPAMKIDLRTGEVWAFSDLLRSLLMVSANDAAVALGEQAATTLDAFADQMAKVAAKLGLQDGPVLRDPAGLDDEFSVAGGNELSARDLAIATRALLANKLLRDIVGTREYHFKGGDGVDHKLINHNKLLRTYPGAIGVKTGYTRKAGHTLVAAATRNGRTMIAVVLKADDAYRSASGLLDKGFATPVSAQAGLDRLPPVGVNAPAARTTPAPVPTPTNAGRVTGVSTVRRPPPQGDTSLPGERVRDRKTASKGGIGTVLSVLVLGLIPAAAIGAIARPRTRRPPKHQHARANPPQRQHAGRPHSLRERQPAKTPSPAPRPRRPPSPAPVPKPPPAAPRPTMYTLPSGRTVPLREGWRLPPPSRHARTG